MKALIHINNCPIHLIEQVKYKIEKFITNVEIEVCDDLETADVFIIVYPVVNKLVFCIDKTKSRGTTNYIVDI